MAGVTTTLTVLAAVVLALLVFPWLGWPFYTELLTTTQRIYALTFETIPLLLVASAWYLIMTTVLSIGQYYLERHFGRGATRALPETPIQRLRRNLFTFRHATVEVPAAKSVEMPKGPREGR